MAQEAWPLPAPLAWPSVPSPPAQGSSPTQSHERERAEPMVRKVPKTRTSQAKEVEEGIQILVADAC